VVLESLFYTSQFLALLGGTFLQYRPAPDAPPRYWPTLERHRTQDLDTKYSLLSTPPLQKLPHFIFQMNFGPLITPTLHFYRQRLPLPVHPFCELGHTFWGCLSKRKFAVPPPLWSRTVLVTPTPAERNRCSSNSRLTQTQQAHCLPFFSFFSVFHGFSPHPPSWPLPPPPPSPG